MAVQADQPAMLTPKYVTGGSQPDEAGARAGAHGVHTVKVLSVAQQSALR